MPTPTTPSTRELLASFNTRNPYRLRHYWYLAEWKHTIEHGKPITGQEFQQGDTAEVDQIIQVFLAGPQPPAWLARLRLSKTARAAVRHVNRTCTPKPLSELQRLVHSTHPYLTLNQGDPINLPKAARAYAQFQR